MAALEESSATVTRFVGKGEPHWLVPDDKFGGWSLVLKSDLSVLVADLLEKTLSGAIFSAHVLSVCWDKNMVLVSSIEHAHSQEAVHHAVSG